MGIQPIEKNEIIENIHSENGITPQKNFPLNKNNQPQTMGIGELSNQNKKSNFEKIYTIKRKPNIIPKQVVNDFDNNNNNNEEAKCKTNRNDNRFQLLGDNNGFINNNDKIFNTDYKINTLKINNDNLGNKNKQNLSVKDISTEKSNDKENYRKIQTKHDNLKENNENKISHSKYQSSNLMAYSKKNQSFTKINKYLINLNNNSINNNYKQIRKNNINSYNTYTTKKISEGNIIHKKNTEMNANNNNNSHMFKPISKYSLNTQQQPIKPIESKNTFTNSSKNLSLGNKSSMILNNMNNKNGNQIINNGSTKSDRYIITTNKEKRNSAYLSVNNNNFNNNILNDTIKKNFANLNEQYKYQSQLIKNSINNNLTSFSNQNINNVNERKPKKHLSLNNPGNNSMLSTNNFIANRNINNIFSTRLKRDITSKIRQISIQKSLPNNNFRINNQTNNSSKHNLSMQSIQLNNNINNFNYNFNGDKIRKIKTYKFSNIDKSYQNSTFNSTSKINNYHFGKYNTNLNTNINSNNYLMTDLGRTKKDPLIFDKKKNFLI